MSCTSRVAAAPTRWGGTHRVRPASPHLVVASSRSATPRMYEGANGNVRSDLQSCAWPKRPLSYIVHKLRMPLGSGRAAERKERLPQRQPSPPTADGADAVTARARRPPAAAASASYAAIEAVRRTEGHVGRHADRLRHLRGVRARVRASFVP
eukprot:scaffold108519_cov78-Phaeocystis_antarctica.AAC.7